MFSEAWARQRAMLPILLFCSLTVLLPHRIHAADITYSGEGGYALSTSDDLVFTDTLTGTWVRPSGSSAGNFFGGINVTGSNTVTNQGSISLTATNNDSSTIYIYGMHVDATGVLINRGDINVTAYGDFLGPRGMHSEASAKAIINQGTVTVTSYGDHSRTQGVDGLNDNLMLTNSGTVTVTSYGDGSMVRAFMASGVNIATANSGTVAAVTHGANSDAQAVYANGYGTERVTFRNSGTISATALGGGTAYAIYANNYSDVHLLPGTHILSGEVYSSSINNNLYLDNEGTVDFTITGAWGTLHKTGSGLWTITKDVASGVVGGTDIQAGTFRVARGISYATGDLALASGATLGVYASGQGTASVTSANSPNLSGSIVVYSTAAGAATTSTLVSTSGVIDGYTLITDQNPNFTITDTTSSTSAITVSTAFTPQADTSSLGAMNNLAATGRFAQTAMKRATSRLADTGVPSREKRQMLASTEDITGLLRLDDPGKYFFLRPVAGRSQRDAGSSEGYDADFIEMIAGMDTLVSRNWLVGVMAGVGHTTVDFTGDVFYRDDRERQVMFTVGPYVGYRTGPWRVTDSLTYSRVSNTYERNAGLNETADADYASNLLRNQLTGAYEWNVSDNWDLTPRAGLSATWLHRESFSEKNAVNAVSYNDLDKVFCEGTASLLAFGHYQQQNKKISPYLGVGVRQSLSSNDITVRQYLPTTSARVTTDNDDTHFTCEAGVAFVKDNYTFNLEYDGEMSSSEQSHMFSAFLSWRF